MKNYKPMFSVTVHTTEGLIESREFHDKKLAFNSARISFDEPSTDAVTILKL